jgi:hypothetical protein
MRHSVYYRGATQAKIISSGVPGLKIAELSAEIEEEFDVLIGPVVKPQA